MADKNTSGGIIIPEPTAEHMGLREFAVTVKLDPLFEAGLMATVLPFERTLAEWLAELEAFKTRPVRNV